MPAKKKTNKGGDKKKVPLRKSDLSEGGGEANLHEALVLRAELVDFEAKNGKTYDCGELDVAFEHCERWQTPNRTEDGTAFQTSRYFVNKSDESDWGMLVTFLEDMGWELEDFSELEGCTFKWQAIKRGTYTAKNGEEKDNLVWFPVELIED